MPWQPASPAGVAPLPAVRGGRPAGRPRAGREPQRPPDLHEPGDGPRRRALRLAAGAGAAARRERDPGGACEREKPHVPRAGTPVALSVPPPLPTVPRSPSVRPSSPGGSRGRAPRRPHGARPRPRLPRGARGSRSRAASAGRHRARRSRRRARSPRRRRARGCRREANPVESASGGPTCSGACAGSGRSPATPRSAVCTRNWRPTPASSASRRTRRCGRPTSCSRSGSTARAAS